MMVKYKNIRIKSLMDNKSDAKTGKNNIWKNWKLKKRLS